MKRLLIIGLALVLSACASTRSKDALTTTLYDYSAAIRWNEIEDAWSFVDPEFKETHPLTDLERQRFKHVRFSEYTVKGSKSVGEGRIERVVEIALINQHTQSLRSMRVRELWRWDEEAKRWWLANGLPDITPSE